MATAVAPPPPPRRSQTFTQQLPAFSPTKSSSSAPPPKDEALRKKEEEEALRKKEADRLAREQADEIKRLEQIENDKKRLDVAWQEHCNARHRLPPDLLPLEEEAELENFLDRLVGVSPTFVGAVINALRDRIHKKAKTALSKVRGIESSLKWAGRLSFGKVSNLLSRVKISLSPPSWPDKSVEGKIAASQQLLRKSWDYKVRQGEQAVFTVYQAATKTLVHIGSGDHGGIFVTVDDVLEPEAVAEKFLARLCSSISKLIPQQSMVAIIDGAHRNINIKRYLRNAVVVRTFADKVDRLLSNLHDVLSRNAPRAATASLAVGIPSTPTELTAVFKKNPPDWSIWKKEFPRWERVVGKAGFSDVKPSSKEQILLALTEVKDVLILVAHSDGKHIFLPAPPPEGSTLSTQDIVDHAEAIRKNGPLVYLFCCETAQVSDLKNFAEVLLESGAVGVVAPQTKIHAHLSARLFEQLVRPGHHEKHSLAALHRAEKRTGYREMEVWVG